MATRFLRIDLSDGARDFRPIALEPGVALLDRSGANAKILLRWLGGKVAEPVWEEDAVGFFVRDDRGGRLEDAVCQPATAEDLKKLLSDELAVLKDRIERAKPETPTERDVKRTLRRCFEDLTSDPDRTDLDSYFFRYRDAQGRWRLVWCWGYQRVDQEPAAAVICADPECNLLFMRRPGKSPKCPSCAAALLTQPPKKSRWKAAALLLLLLLLLAALAYWYLWPRPLVVRPQELAMVVGEITDLQIESPDDAPVSVASTDTSLLEITDKNRLVARGEGSVTVEVTQGYQRQTVDVTIGSAEFESIAIEPAEVLVPADGSVRVRVRGRIAADETAREVEIAPDGLTWESRPEALYADFDAKSMKVRGRMPTDPAWPQTLAARFQQRQASAPVEVYDPDGPDPPRQDVPKVVKIIPYDFEEPGPGQLVRILLGAEFDDFRVETECEDPETGEQFTRYITKKATLSTPEPPDGAIVSTAGGHLIGTRVGRTAVVAEYRGVRSELPLQVEVAADVEIDEIRIDPEELTVKPNGRRDLDIVAYQQGRLVGVVTGLQDASFNSDRPEVASVDSSSGLVTGVSEGEALVTAQFGELQSEPVTVRVVKSLPVLTDLQIEPAAAVIHPGQALEYRVTAMRGDRRVVLGPEDEVRLFARDSSVADAFDDLWVGGAGVGQTAIVAELGTLQAEAALEVTPGDLATLPETLRLPGGGVVVGPGYLPGIGWSYVPGRGFVKAPRPSVPPIDVPRLEIRPDSFKLSLNSEATEIRMVETHPDGSERDVTSDPALAINQPTGVIRVEKTPDGYMVRPVEQGEAQITATYDGREATAHVTVAGTWFTDVYITINAATRAWSSVRVLADPSAGPLEYRLSGTAETPPSQWISAGQSEPDRPWQVELPIPPGQRGPTDSLVIEARDASGKTQDYRVSISMLPGGSSTDNR